MPSLQIVKLLAVLACRTASPAIAGQPGQPTAPPPAEALRVSNSLWTVTLAEIRKVHSRRFPQVEIKQPVLRVIANDGRTPPRTLVLRGDPHDDYNFGADPDELRLVDSTLVVLSPTCFAVADLTTGRQQAFVFAAANIAASPDGRRVAYEEFQPHFTPPEATGSIIRVMDVASLAEYTVFPEASRTYASGDILLTWEDDLDKVHRAGSLHWSPDGRRLVFSCIHDVLNLRDPKVPVETYLVAIDLRDLRHSRYLHEPKAKEQYVLPGAEVEAKRRPRRLSGRSGSSPRPLHQSPMAAPHALKACRSTRPVSVSVPGLPADSM